MFVFCIRKFSDVRRIYRKRVEVLKVRLGGITSKIVSYESEYAAMEAASVAFGDEEKRLAFAEVAKQLSKHLERLRKSATQVQDRIGFYDHLDAQL